MTSTFSNLGLQEARERRTAIATKLHHALNDKEAAWTAEAQSAYDQGLAEMDALDAQIKRHNDLNERLATDAMGDSVRDSLNRHERDKGSLSPSAALFSKWLRGGDAALTAQDWQSIRTTMSTTTPAQGGYTVQTDVAKSISDAMKAYGGMREVSTILQTASGNPLTFPTSDGTAEVGEQIAENVTATAADPSFGTISLNTYKYSSKIVAVPMELLQDSAVDIEAFVISRMTQRLARIMNTKFTLGTGTAEPNGIVTAAGSGKVGTTGQTLSVIVDDLIDLVHAVDPAYRALNRCRFMMNDSSLKVIRKLKDTAGRPIYIPGYDGLGGAMPDSLLGYPITINQDIAVMAANAKSILFGDFSFYTIRDVMEATVFRFADSPYIKLGQIGFLMWQRSGGTFTDVGGAVKYYTNSAT